MNEMPSQIIVKTGWQRCCRYAMPRRQRQTKAATL